MSIEITKVSAGILAKAQSGEITPPELDAYRAFLREVDSKFMDHRIIVDNRYCRWFARGEMTRSQLRHFIQQFSVFSHFFLVAQLKKMINAGSLEGYRASKEILANELGVIFRKPGHTPATPEGRLSDAEKDLSTDPELVSTEGTVDGGTFKFKAGHFEWLLRIGEQLGMGFSDLGKRRHGTPSTLFFCDELERLYGSEDANIGEGASFAVENWAAAGFWKQLVEGLKRFKEREIPDLKLAFFTWHDAVEDQHATHTQDELAGVFFTDGFDRGKFISGGLEMLDGVARFWDGLYDDRNSASAAA
jgi:hypothetical protein